jgi:conjugal transfer pilus assembly protein TrbC
MIKTKRHIPKILAAIGCVLTSLVLLLTSVAGSSPSASAQQALRTPDAASITKEMERIETERKTLFSQPGMGGKPSFPNIATPTPGAAVDLESVVKQYQARAAIPPQDDVYVFASFTMPPGSLKRLVDDAAKIGATVIFRGFKNNSMRETAQLLATYKNDRVHAVVNPLAFTKYRVNAVPTIALLLPQAKERVDGEGHALPETYAAVLGDVPLEYGLEHIAKSQPAFKTIADRYVKLIRSTL